MYKQFLISMLFVATSVVIAHPDITDVRPFVGPIEYSRINPGQRLHPDRGWYIPIKDGSDIGIIRLTYRDKDNKLCLGALHVEGIPHDSAEHILKNLDNPLYQQRIAALKKKRDTGGVFEGGLYGRVTGVTAPNLLQKLWWWKITRDEETEIRHDAVVKRIIERDKQLKPLATMGWNDLVAENPQIKTGLVKFLEHRPAYSIMVNKPNPRISIYHLKELSEEVQPSA